MLHTIGKFTLHNDGWFVCKGKVAYEDDDGQTIITEAETGGILLNGIGDVDPGALGVADGTKIWLHVDIAGGNDPQASQAFLYGAGSPRTANYNISGVTFSNRLGLLSIT